jgi:hypothetical protein
MNWFDDGGNGGWGGPYSVPVWGSEGYEGSFFVFPDITRNVSFAPSDGGGTLSRIETAQIALERMQPALHNVASKQDIFTIEQLDCISGIETGRTWDVNKSATNGRVGLFQFNETNWKASGTSIPWENGKSAKDPEAAASVALALLFRKLGYSGVGQPTESAVQTAIDNFGEGDERYGKAVMDCEKALKSGNFRGAYQILLDYANWVAGGRP